MFKLFELKNMEGDLWSRLKVSLCCKFDWADNIVGRSLHVVTIKRCSLLINTSLSLNLKLHPNQTYPNITYETTVALLKLFKPHLLLS